MLSVYGNLQILPGYIDLYTAFFWFMSSIFCLLEDNRNSTVYAHEHALFFCFYFNFSHKTTSMSIAKVTII